MRLALPSLCPVIMTQRSRIALLALVPREKDGYNEVSSCHLELDLCFRRIDNDTGQGRPSGALPSIYIRLRAAHY